MKFWRLFASVLLLTGAAWSQALSGDQLGEHDLSASSLSAVKGGVANACLYCHAPHGAMTAPTPLWNQQLSVQTYQMYGSTTYHQTGLQPPVGSPSKLCLSCHDGTVALGQTVAYGNVTVGGTMKASSNFGTDLRSSHPFSLKTPIADAPNLSQLLQQNPAQTADPAVRMINGTIECTTCHQPHFQNIDKQLPQFLVRDSSSSQLCLSCHDPARLTSGQANQLAGWALSAHATSTATTSNNPYVGGYSTVAMNGCNACHMPHSASGPARLLRATDQLDCMNCHNGSNTQPLAPNIFAEMTNSTSVTKIPHPFPSAANPHDPLEPAVLNNNRHAGCVDCHNPHAAQANGALTAPPGIRLPQTAVTGVSGQDGMTALTPAVNQFETCLRCHGTSSGKGTTTSVNYGYIATRVLVGADPLNLIPQMAATAASSHPVMHDRSSTLLQPSLLPQMLNLDGTVSTRGMGTRIFCTDCHNSDDNREFGGGGANGPHGSKYNHVLERRYDMSQTSTPGSLITNALPNPDLTNNGPYAMCAKCHDLSLVLSGSAVHQKHVNEVGASCSVCHTPHGIGTPSATITGQRLVNFDGAVVAPNGTSPVTFDGAARTCTLACHGATHDKSIY
jgi:predicted CXXCH cytochrome family protein